MSGQGWYARLVERAGALIAHDTPADGPPPRTIYAFFRWCLAGAWWLLAVAMVLSALTGASEVFTMWLLGRVVDSAVLPGSIWQNAGGLIVLGVALLVVIRPAIFGASALFQSVVIGPNVFNLTLSRLHRHTLGHAVNFFDDDFAGRIAQKEIQAATSLTETVIETVNAVLFGLASVIAAMVLAAAINPWLVLIMALWFAAYALFLRWSLPRVRARSKARAAARANVTGQIVDTITNIKTVKLFAHDRHEDRAALGAMGRFRQRALEFGAMSVIFRFGLIFLAGLLPLFMVGAGLGLRGQGVSPGDIAAIGAVSIRLAQMTGWISFTLMAIYGHIGEVEDAMHTLTPPHGLPDAPDAAPLRSTDGIAFDRVTFEYGGETGGVRDLSLKIAPGEKLGIVGASGAGKSTLVSLLLRLYDPESGTVRIGGQDIAHVTQDSLRRQIGMVTQETAMFNRAARDNILYGRPDADEEALIDAARRAEADDFIRDLQDIHGRQGYDAHLGERAVKLSGGQRQRIALARAILKDAPILVLDEATSALDSEVEASIQEALERVMEGKTVLAIAHRLSTIARMDRIVVMDAGRIVEQGSHEELLAQNGLYARYWNRQSGGFIDTRTEAAE
jgi:ATP-binding cassette subfamily B protein